VALFAPWGAGLPFPASLAVFWGEVLVVVLAVALVAATHARLRMDRALRFYAGLLAAAVGAAGLASAGW
jgi:formate hydrogenlyase subunit 4